MRLSRFWVLGGLRANRTLLPVYSDRSGHAASGSITLHSVAAFHCNQQSTNSMSASTARGAAVKESCLATSFRSIFFFVIDPTSEIPLLGCLKLFTCVNVD